MPKPRDSLQQFQDAQDLVLQHCNDKPKRQEKTDAVVESDQGASGRTDRCVDE